MLRQVVREERVSKPASQPGGGRDGVEVGCGGKGRDTGCCCFAGEVFVGTSN